MMRIGSLTKLFTGLALLALRDEGRLSLEDPLAKYVPEAAQLIYPTSDAPPVRLRNLLTHTSGLPRQLPNVDEPLSRDALLKGLRGLELDFAPGVREQYSNLGVVLLGQVVERVSGEGYRRFLDQRILGPLGMSSSGWEAVELNPRLIARGHVRNPQTGEYVAAGGELKAGVDDAAGGLYSSIEDMARFIALIAASHRLRLAERPAAPGRSGQDRESRRTPRQLK